MSITVIGRPDNLRYSGNAKMQLVESDVYNVCNRIKEIDPNLFVVLHEGHAEPFVVVEKCVDGEERLVKRYAELTPQILTDLRRMLSIPWEQRWKALAAEVDKHNEDMGNSWMESEGHERFVWEMRNALHESNIADITKPVFMHRKRK